MVAKDRGVAGFKCDLGLSGAAEEVGRALIEHPSLHGRIAFVLEDEFDDIPSIDAQDFIGEPRHSQILRVGREEPGADEGGEDGKVVEENERLETRHGDARQREGNTQGDQEPKPLCGDDHSGSMLLVGPSLCELS